jgi:two-component system LytT family response regulator
VPGPRLVVKTAGIIHFVQTTDIDWIDTVGVYVDLYVGGKVLLYRSPIHQPEDKRSAPFRPHAPLAHR